MEECRGRVERALATIAVGAGWDARREMRFHAALAQSLILTTGSAGPKIKEAWTKAFGIAESLDDAEYQLRSLWSLWFHHTNSGPHHVALTLAQKFCSLAATQSDPSDRLVGERLIGTSRYYLGDWSARGDTSKACSLITSLPTLARTSFDFRSTWA